MSELAAQAREEEALDELYDHLDRYGATKRVAYLIAALIDAKVEIALEAHRQAIGSQATQVPEDTETAD